MPDLKELIAWNEAEAKRLRPYAYNIGHVARMTDTGARSANHTATADILRAAEKVVEAVEAREAVGYPFSPPNPSRNEAVVRAAEALAKALTHD